MLPIRINTYVCTAFIIIGLFCIPLLLHAAEGGFVSLIAIPGIEELSREGIQKYVNVLLRVAIIAAALLAVVKLILAGAQYILSGVVTNKESAKKDIWSALLGLLIVLAAVTLLRTINPSLVDLPALNPLSKITFPEITVAVGTSFDSSRVVDSERAKFLMDFKKACEKGGGIYVPPSAQTDEVYCTPKSTSDSLDQALTTGIGRFCISKTYTKQEFENHKNAINSFIQGCKSRGKTPKGAATKYFVEQICYEMQCK